MSPMAAKELLYQAYESSLGIYDYVSQAVEESRIKNPSLKRPLSSVALHYAEDYTGQNTRLGQVAKAFYQFNMAVKFGYSFSEFLQLPIEYVDLLMRIAKDNSQLEAKVQEGVIQDLKNAANPKK